MKPRRLRQMALFRFRDRGSRVQREARAARLARCNVRMMRQLTVFMRSPEKHEN